MPSRQFLRSKRTGIVNEGEAQFVQQQQQQQQAMPQQAAGQYESKEVDEEKVLKLDSLLIEKSAILTQLRARPANRMSLLEQDRKLAEDIAALGRLLGKEILLNRMRQQMMRDGAISTAQN